MSDPETLHIADARYLDGKTVYLSGAITSDPLAADHFRQWRFYALSLGAARIFDPTLLPPGWTYAEYMEHCMLMVRRADLVLALPTWQESNGAKAEIAYAHSLGVRILYGVKT